MNWRALGGWRSGPAGLEVGGKDDPKQILSFPASNLQPLTSNLGALGAEGIILHQVPDSARAGCSAKTTANTKIRIYQHFQTVFLFLFLGDGPLGTDGYADAAITA